MDITKSKVLLNKINSLFQNAESTHQDFSKLEKELLLQYLREFYDAVREPALQTVKPQETEIAFQNRISESVVTEKIQEVETLSATYSNGHDKDHSAQQEKEVSSATISMDDEEAVDEIKAIFDEMSLIDASNRFANSPVDDISKTMGINERILTINELFKGDQKKFQEVVTRLNACASFDEAKQYLISEVAKSYDWGAEKRRKKVEIFLSLVRRRYL